MNRSGPLKIKIQIFCGDEIAMGPGKADLLDAIEKHGSISAAGRALGMSYRRTWLLVDAMNRCWRDPLVDASAGGSHGGGAKVTPFGWSILEQYRALCQGSRNAAEGPALDSLVADLLSAPRDHQEH